MSVKHEMRKNEHGDPVWTITTIGGYDIYRLARVMERGQVEFCAIARSALPRLKRHLGVNGYSGLERYLYCRTPEEQAEADAQPDPRLADVRRATYDPGRFCKRRHDEGPEKDETEPLFVWQARAVLHALDGTTDAD